MRIALQIGGRTFELGLGEAADAVTLLRAAVHLVTESETIVISELTEAQITDLAVTLTDELIEIGRGRDYVQARERIRADRDNRERARLEGLPIYSSLYSRSMGRHVESQCRAKVDEERLRTPLPPATGVLRGSGDLLVRRAGPYTRGQNVDCAFPMVECICERGGEVVEPLPDAVKLRHGDSCRCVICEARRGGPTVAM